MIFVQGITDLSSDQCTINQNYGNNVNNLSNNLYSCVTFFDMSD